MPASMFRIVWRGCAGLAVVTILLSSNAALAQIETPGSAKDFELTQLRLELKRIVDSEPERADAARKALADLDSPETTLQGRQARNRRERDNRRIVNGVVTLQHAAVAALLKGADHKSAALSCTGTLVACDKVLTAAHCVCGKDVSGRVVSAADCRTRLSAREHAVLLPGRRHLQGQGGQLARAGLRVSAGDIAVLTLDRPVEGIAPMAVSAGPTPINNTVGTIAGFGRTGGSRQDQGIKREGSVLTKACPPDAQGKKLFCWDFSADIPLPDEHKQSNTCEGDSGGGVFFLDREGGRPIHKVFGVVAGGDNTSECVRKDTVSTPMSASTPSRL